MTTRVPIRYGGTGANTAADARTALGVAPAEAFDVANTASSTANTAYDAANTANTNALAAYGQANLAYAQANAAYDAANNAQVTVYANNASNVTTQNINFVNTATVTVAVTANGSNANIEFTAAPQTVVNDTFTAVGNTAAAATANIANGLYAISTSAYDQANAAYGQANDAYGAANTANTNALDAYAQANTARNTANAAYGQANDAYSQANTAYGQANAAYGAANTANTNALTAYGQANLAYTQANAAYNQANLAYAEANLKLNLSGGVIVGDVSITGNLFVNGTETIVNTQSLTINDPIFLLANNNTTNAVGLGFVAHYGPTQQHTGLIRAHQDNIWYLFEDYDDHILYANNVLDTGNIKLATLKANINANSLLLVGNTVATQANLTIVYDTANTAYGQANLAYAQANAGYDQANTARNTANAAYDSANTANTNALAAYGQANAAYTAANNSANTVRVSQNGAATLSAKQLNFVNTANITIAVTDSGDGNANIEFELTTGGGTLSNIAISSNSVFATNANAFNFVNTATVQITVEPGINGNANISFAAAGGTAGGSAAVKDVFFGNGANDTFVLSTTPVANSYTLVFVDRVYQETADYRLNGSQLEFLTGAPPANSVVEVFTYFGTSQPGIMLSDLFVGSGSCTQFALSQTCTTDRTFVYLNGVSQRPDADYQVNGATLTLNAAPALNTNVHVRTIGIYALANANLVLPATFMTDTFTATGSCTQFTMSQAGTTNSTFVFLNGISQKPLTDFYIANGVLTFTSAPANGIQIETRSVGNFSLVEIDQSRVDSDRFTGDGACTTFSLSAATSTAKAFVYIDGVSQKPYIDYNLAGQQIVFANPPDNGTIVEVRTLSEFQFVTDYTIVAYEQANAAYAQANAARDQANTGYAQANVAYGQANLAYAQANTARDTANDAYGQANTALNTAIAAYAQANTKASIGLVIALS